MKTKNALFLIAILITAQSCTIFSLNPLYHKKDLIDEPELLGLWREEGDGIEFWEAQGGGKEYVSFEKYEDKKYIFRYMEEDEGPQDIDTISYEAGLLKIGDHYFIDLYPYYDQELEEGDYLFRGFIPTHAVLKIEWHNSKMELYFFSYDRLEELFKQNRIRIRHQMFEDYIVITASTDELQKFIRKYADDEKAFDDASTFIKIK
jgi:hypothetical protein